MLCHGGVAAVALWEAVQWCKYAYLSLTTYTCVLYIPDSSENLTCGEHVCHVNMKKNRQSPVISTRWWWHVYASR